MVLMKIFWVGRMVVDVLHWLPAPWSYDRLSGYYIVRSNEAFMSNATRLS